MGCLLVCFFLLGPFKCDLKRKKVKVKGSKIVRMPSTLAAMLTLFAGLRVAGRHSSAKIDKPLGPGPTTPHSGGPLF